MQKANQSIEMVPIEHKHGCLKFASDNSCTFGEYCKFAHHENLDPLLVGTLEPIGYMVPNETGQACQTCYEHGRECDKKRRPDKDDPCPECRWLGGENRTCELAMNTSYNDQVWKHMMDARKSEFVMGDPKPRDAPKKIKNKNGPHTYVPVTPMPNSRVKHDWTGEDRETTLGKEDILPAGVRECPRAFIVPPRLSNTRIKGRKRMAENDEQSAARDRPDPWSSSSRATAQQPQLPPLLPPPSFERPQADGAAGQAMFTTWNWEMKMWTHIYETGYEVTLPSLPVEARHVPSPFPRPFSAQSASSARFAANPTPVYRPPPAPAHRPAPVPAYRPNSAPAHSPPPAALQNTRTSATALVPAATHQPPTGHDTTFRTHANLSRHDVKGPTRSTSSTTGMDPVAAVFDGSNLQLSTASPASAIGPTQASAPIVSEAGSTKLEYQMLVDSDPELSDG